jgi:hypothetical protein
MSLKQIVEHKEHMGHLDHIKHPDSHSIYENILGCRTSLSKEEILETLKELQVNLKY